jgi:hypothetical protein
MAGGRSTDRPARRFSGAPPFRRWFLKGWVLPRFGFSLASLSLGLVRHHRPALHDPFHVVQSTLLSALTAKRRARVPVSVIFENLKAGANIDEIMEWFEGLEREQVEAVIEFAARSLDVTPASTVSR